MRKAGVAALAFAAGLFGGIASRYLSPQTAHAESYPTEVRSRSFVLINQQGVPIGTFSEESGRPSLKLYDTGGREIWSAGGELRLRTPAVGK